MKRKLCFMLVLLLATLCPAMAETADDPVVVRVGDFTYTQSVLQGSLDSMIELSRMLSGGRRRPGCRAPWTALWAWA